MSDADKALKLLEVVRLANTGKLVWDVVGPLLQGAMEQDLPTVTIADLADKSALLGQHITELDIAIAAKELRDAIG
jgi:hypothetical protein